LTIAVYAFGIPIPEASVMTFELAAAAPRVCASPSRIRVLHALFFLSGFPALIYQLTWQRSLFRVFGVNTESVTIVVTAFMLGLGIGSIAGGWITRRRRINALLLLGVIELSTALFGIVSLAIFEFVGRLALDWPLPGVAVVNLLLVLVPTLLMGATLPILVSHLVRTSGQTGAAVGTLYYVNTMGAGAACIACGTLIFPHIGMHGAIWVASGINVIVGVGALITRSRYREQAVEDAPSAAVPIEQPLLSKRFVMGIAALGGFISLSYEIFLFRTVAFASGSSTFAFALTLAAFLMGVAGGSYEAGTICAKHSPRDAMRKAVVSLTWANVFAAIFLPLMTQLASTMPGLIGITLLTIYLIARQWGGLLPYLSQFAITADDGAGMQTALLYFSNIVGCTIGSVLTGFVLTSYFGLHGSRSCCFAAAPFACCLWSQNSMFPTTSGWDAARSPWRFWRSLRFSFLRRRAACWKTCSTSATRVTPSPMSSRTGTASLPSTPTAPYSATACMTAASISTSIMIGTASYVPTR